MCVKTEECASEFEPEVLVSVKCYSKLNSCTYEGRRTGKYIRKNQRLRLLPLLKDARAKRRDGNLGTTSVQLHKNSDT